MKNPTFSPRIYHSRTVSFFYYGKGFSLLEILIVLALMAAISVFTLMAISGKNQGAELRHISRLIATELRYARTLSMATGKPQQFILDIKNHSWEIPNQRRGEISPTLSLHFIGAKQLQTQPQLGVIGFYPEGASSGGIIELAIQNTKMQIKVSWLTGEVTVNAEQQPVTE